MKQFNLSDEVLNNLMVFLDRVDLKGLKEVNAMNQILHVFTHPADLDPEDQSG